MGNGQTSYVRQPKVLNEIGGILAGAYCLRFAEALTPLQNLTSHSLSLRL